MAVTVAVVLLLVVGTAAGYVAFLNHTVTSNVHHQALLPDSSTPAPKRDAAAKNAQNILFIGSDGRAGLGGQRSDVIMLMHVNDARSKVYLVHFPRDLYVSVPGHGKDKINAAFAYGGAPLLVQTLQNLVHVPIDHVAIVGFEGFKAMTDAVGGVDVYAEESSTSPEGNVHRGYNHLNGAAALAFVRERHQLSEGDISRGRRQQAFMKALMLKGLSKDTLTNPLTLAGFIDAGTKNLTVDDGFDMSEMRSEAFALRSLRGSDITFVTAPFSGFGRSPVGASIDVLNEEGMARLSAALRKDAMASYSAGTQIP